VPTDRQQPCDPYSDEPLTVESLDAEIHPHVELAGDIRQVILGYLRDQLMDDPDRKLLLSMAAQLLEELD
jgi:hypothetical protein